MMMTPEHEYQQHIVRRDALIHAARVDRLMHEASASRDQLPKRLLLILSDAMIGGGERLKRYARRTTRLRPLTGAETHLELLHKL